MVSRANEFMCAVGHGTTSNLWYVLWKKLRGKQLKKQKSRFLDFSRLSALEGIERYLQIFLSTLTLCV